jgi:hypothetical protein
MNYEDTGEKLILKCKKCQFVRENIQDVCVYYKQFIKNSYDIKIDPDLCYDNTLAYTDNIECKNQYCPSNGFNVFTDKTGYKEAEWDKLSDAEKDKYKGDLLPKIKYFHYNTDMKLAYICCYCMSFWKN